LVQGVHIELTQTCPPWQSALVVQLAPGGPTHTPFRQTCPIAQAGLQGGGQPSSIMPFPLLSIPAQISGGGGGGLQLKPTHAVWGQPKMTSSFGFCAVRSVLQAVPCTVTVFVPAT